MTITRLLGTWALLAIAMSANGVFREMVLRPRVPDHADTLSVLLGAAIILGVTSLLFRGFARHSRVALVQAGLLLMGMTVAFEFAVGRLVDHQSWTELLGNYAIWRGELWPLLLLLVGLTPFIWARWFAPGARNVD